MISISILKRDTPPSPEVLALRIKGSYKYVLIQILVQKSGPSLRKYNSVERLLQYRILPNIVRSEQKLRLYNLLELSNTSYSKPSPFIYLRYQILRLRQYSRRGFQQGDLSLATYYIATYSFQYRRKIVSIDLLTVLRTLMPLLFEILIFLLQQTSSLTYLLDTYISRLQTSILDIIKQNSPKKVGT